MKPMSPTMTHLKEGDAKRSLDILSWAFSGYEISPGQPIWIDADNPNRQVTYAECKTTIKKIIRGLRFRGIQEGDTVCVQSYNDIWYPVLYLAIIGSGARFVASSPAYKVREISLLLKESTARFIIVQDSQLEKVSEAAAGVGLNRRNIIIFDDLCVPAPNSPQTLGSLCLHGSEHWLVFDDEARARDTPAVLLSTSGTTGPPKLAVMAHLGIVSQAAHIEAISQHRHHIKPSQGAAAGPCEIRRLIVLPMGHSFMLPFHLATLRRGEKTFVMSRYDEYRFVDCVVKHQITTTPLVPPIVQVLLRSAQAFDKSLRDIICAGAPLDRKTQQKLAQKLSCDARITQLWGMTELGLITGFAWPEKDTSGSVGRLLENVEAKIVKSDRTGSCGEEEESGEILIKSDSMMLGYLDGPGRLIGLAARSWFATGDIGHCKEGKWYLTDRHKDLIKVRGWQVSPTEIEVCLKAHWAVEDAAVVGWKSEDKAEERPIAFVVLKSGVEVDGLAAAILAGAEKQLASYKKIHTLKFVTKLPRSPTGKVLRRVLLSGLDGTTGDTFTRGLQ